MVRSGRADTLLALGSNLGDRRKHLRCAIDGLGRVGEVVGVSALYESDPAGLTDQDAFLNAAVRVTTRLDALRLFVWIKSLEFAAGRRPGVPMGPRPLDIDIVAYGHETLMTDRITIPHPRFADRPFVVAPLTDIAPETVIPGESAPLRDIDAQLGRPGVRRLETTPEQWPGPR